MLLKWNKRPLVVLKHVRDDNLDAVLKQLQMLKICVIFENLNLNVQGKT